MVIFIAFNSLCAICDSFIERDSYDKIAKSAIL